MERGTEKQSAAFAQNQRWELAQRRKGAKKKQIQKQPFGY
jgi:hypothetical protein